MVLMKSVFQKATLWYHDHALGMTRLNVLAGLAGFYIVRDPNDTLVLPNGTFDIPLLIQDRMFDPSDGSLVLPSDGDVPSVHPYWKMQFL
jgi:spore coat protein A